MASLTPPSPVEPNVSQSEKSYEVSEEKIIGQNHVIFGGLCFVGPKQQMSILTLIMIIIPSILFDSLLVPWYYYKIGLIWWLLCIILLAFLESTSLGLYITTAYTDPGIIPKANSPLTSYDALTNQYRLTKPPKFQDVIIRGRLFRLKYCDTCNIYRSPRTIHCYVCNNCVESFDHHCPWIGNCVGRRNYRRFYAFLVVTSLLIIYVLTASIGKIFIVFKFKQQNSHSLGSLRGTFEACWDAFLLTAYSLIVIWFVMGLCAYHSYLIATNQSTYEQIKDFYEPSANPWDQGLCHNIVNTFCEPQRQNLYNPKNLFLRSILPEPTRLPTCAHLPLPDVTKSQITQMALETGDSEQHNTLHDIPEHVISIPEAIDEKTMP